MNDKLMSTNNLKSICSVIEMATALQLSWTRLYQLITAGVFPTPVYDIRTRRPYYTVELQKICQKVRQTNIGHNGLPALFYSLRRNLTESAPKILNLSNKRKETPSDPIFRELAESLQRMGIREATEELVNESFKKLHPNQTQEGIDTGLLLRGLFRYFKKGLST